MLHRMWCLCQGLAGVCVRRIAAQQTLCMVRDADSVNFGHLYMHPFGALTCCLSPCLVPLQMPSTEGPPGGGSMSMGSTPLLNVQRSGGTGSRGSNGSSRRKRVCLGLQCGPHLEGMYVIW